MFNFFDQHSPLWQQLGEPQALARLDKDFFASFLGLVSSASGNLPLQPFAKLELLNPGNPKSLAPGKTVTARLTVTRDFSNSERVSLKLRVRFKSPPDVRWLKVSFDDQAPKFLRAEREWFDYALSPQDLRAGVNQIRVMLSAEAPRRTDWTDLVLEVRH
jgi:hypothetical protein